MKHTRDLYTDLILNQLRILYMFIATMFRKDIQMTQPLLHPFYVSYVNGDNQEIDEELVFAKSEPDAMRQILTTFEDTKFVYETKSAAEFLNISHA